MRNHHIKLFILLAAIVLIFVPGTRSYAWNLPSDCSSSTGCMLNWTESTGWQNGSFPTRSFTYPSRAVNSCFQASSTKDVTFTYGVDATSGLSLGTGTATITSYTNNVCTTGAQILNDGTVGGVAIGATTTIQLNGTLPAAKWAKITTSSTGGLALAIRSAQAEVTQP